LNGKTS